MAPHGDPVIIANQSPQATDVEISSTLKSLKLILMRINARPKLYEVATNGNSVRIAHQSPIAAIAEVRFQVHLTTIKSDNATIKQ